MFKIQYIFHYFIITCCNVVASCGLIALHCEEKTRKVVIKDIAGQPASQYVTTSLRQSPGGYNTAHLRPDGRHGEYCGGCGVGGREEGRKEGGRS